MNDAGYKVLPMAAFPSFIAIVGGNKPQSSLRAFWPAGAKVKKELLPKLFFVARPSTICLRLKEHGVRHMTFLDSRPAGFPTGHRCADGVGARRTSSGPKTSQLDKQLARVFRPENASNKYDPRDPTTIDGIFASVAAVATSAGSEQTLPKFKTEKTSPPIWSLSLPPPLLGLRAGHAFFVQT